MSVEVRGLWKRFTDGGPPAVADVDFVAPSGKLTALLGPSGAGKSTVLRVVAGLDVPDGGQVRIDDDDVSSRPARDRNVGVVFQSYALFEHLSVRDNVAFGLDVRRRPRAEIDERVGELLALVRLGDYASRRPSQLSGGQRQRVAFARALAVRPRVLLLDEPFGALDRRVRVELREWLRRLHDETKVTTVLVTHDQEEAFEIADHVVVMFDGRVEQAGAPMALYEAPASPRLFTFLGDASSTHAVVRGGEVEAFGVVSSAPEGACEGERVDVFVRPHDLTFAYGDDADGLVGDVVAARALGGRVKLDVMLLDGTRLGIELAPNHRDAVAPRVGDRVRLRARAVRAYRR